MVLSYYVLKPKYNAEGLQMLNASRGCAFIVYWELGRCNRPI